MTEPGSLFIAPGQDRSLALYPLGVLEKMGRLLEESSAKKPEPRAFWRMFYARVQAVELDSQGRLRVPTEMGEYAELKNEVVLMEFVTILRCGRKCVGEVIWSNGRRTSIAFRNPLFRRPPWPPWWMET